MSILRNLFRLFNLIDNNKVTFSVFRRIDPPRFKQDNIPITYMQMGIRHEKGSDQLRLSLPKDLKSYMEETYGIYEKFLYLENKIFRDMDHIKQLRIYPPENGTCELIVIYEIEEPEQLSQIPWQRQTQLV